MHNDSHTQAIRSLSNLGPLRVWSLLVTVFGDLVPDGSLDGPTLSAIMTAIGIKPEATRVALHRLRSDGWIKSEKRGRTSLHSLTGRGRTDSEAARQRIYGEPKTMGRVAEIFLTESAAVELDPAQFAQVTSRVFVCGADTVRPKGAMRLQPTDLQPWLGRQIESEQIWKAYKSLHSVLMDIDEALPEGTQLGALEVAVLRVMIVHAWRRLTLKHPDLPRAAHSPDWRGHDCRALVTTLLSRFARPALENIKAT
jgi:phenylacetic acid degradation operon negative regulatory protein